MLHSLKLGPFRQGLPKTDGGKNLVRSREEGSAIEVEVWELPAAAFGGFVDGIPAPLGIGTVELEDGAQLRGFVCEHYATQGAREITGLGGWRAYLAQRAAPAKVG